MANETNEREFWFLCEGDLTYKRVVALSREHIETGMWFVKGEGTCAVGHQLFNTLSDLLLVAKQNFKRRENFLEILRTNLNRIQSNVAQ